MPGSPATSTTAPETSPPPSTRSSSPTPVARACASSTSTSAIGVAAALTGPAVVVRTGTSPTSSTVPQAWHSPHRPTHLEVTQPHPPQRYAGRGVPLRAVLAAMGRSLGSATDSRRSATRQPTAAPDRQDTDGHTDRGRPQERARPRCGAVCGRSADRQQPAEHALLDLGLALLLAREGADDDERAGQRGDEPLQQLQLALRGRHVLRGLERRVVTGVDG